MDKSILQSILDDYNLKNYKEKDKLCLSCEYYRPVFCACQLSGEIRTHKNDCSYYLHIIGQTRKITKHDRCDLMLLQLDIELKGKEEKNEIQLSLNF